MIRKIGVIGCGWLGLPLAKNLVKHKYEVHGSSTSPEKLPVLQNAGIIPYHLVLKPDRIEGKVQELLSQIHVLIINVPPKLRSGNSESYLEKMTRLHAQIKKSGVTRIIFVSSTSVYGNVNGTVTEKTQPRPITESGNQLLASESLFTNDSNLLTTVIRFGGLIGPNRHPITMLSKKTNLSNGSDPVNLIHLDDCILMIRTILKNNYWGEIFNGVYPLHPSKEEYYTQEARKRGLNPPQYAPGTKEKEGKVIESKSFLGKSHEFHTSIMS
ncbi:SDR family oxidoreductase [Flagellimonas allohymeniacidonis]|uniref:SDR family oxidoreductase n=1 Tax=Flagellimonas allohymeniacidonis TaxID=2517819 RepID=A0A4Q8QAK6_9FLAO|nr:SDR family oxidoreductase [Allomuricauda hymeniacidonis]TAI47281.1 SDR family oxidoreductase [Allomuricauda hymeniacidonis]